MSELVAACFGRDDWPTVSVVMPIRDEAPHLEHAVESVLSQQYPLDFDVCLAVAPSRDGTEAIAEQLAARYERVSVVANPVGTTPAALNAAITSTTGEVVVRVDGHAALSDGYVLRAVETMRRTGAVNVGGRQVPEPETPFEEAVAAATTSWMGTGGATYRLGGTAGPVDTVYLGVFDRAAGNAVGWFDDTLIRNQDYELNIRLRRAGGVVWFDPELSVAYRPRGSIRTLTRQYFEYGYWKAEVIRRHPHATRARQLAPPIVCATILVATALGVRRPLALVAPAGYLAVGCLEASRRRLPVQIVARFVAAVSSIHFSWAAGYFANRAGFIARRIR